MSQHTCTRTHARMHAHTHTHTHTHTKHTKTDLMIFLFVGLPMCMSSHLFGLQTCVFCLKLSQGHYCMSANTKDSGKTALMCRLPWAFAGCICDYSRTSMAQTSLGPWKFVWDMGSSSHWGLIMAPVHEANSDNLVFDFLHSDCMLSVFIRIALMRGF